MLVNDTEKEKNRSPSWQQKKSMGMLTFSNDPPKVYEIPRLEDHLIDELFYQEDEIGEMRHAAFMIECGLEEDPPDGPDVPPIPWDAKSAALYCNPAKQANQCNTTATTKREPPKRTSSMDDIDELESSVSPERREPRRKLTVTKSGTLHGMRAPMTEKSHSSDSIEDLKDEESPRRRAAPVVRQPKKLVKAKSGSLHGLRDAARKVQEANDRKAAVAAAAAANDQPASPQHARIRLVATKSGTLHGMRKAVEDQNSKESPVVRRRLVATKSGTLHGMRRDSAEQSAIGTKDASPVMPKRNFVGRDYTTTLNGGSPTKPTPSQKLKKPERKSSASSGSDDDSLDRFDNSNSDQESDVSLDTDEDIPKSPPKKKDVLPKIPFHGQPRTPIKKPTVVNRNDEGNEKQEDSKPRNRVFRNGKLVTDDGGTPDKTLSSPSNNVVTSVREKIVNGNAAAAHLLRSAQIPRTSLTKTTPIGVPPAFQNNTAVPSLFQSGQKLSSTDKVRPGKVKIPLKVKSMGTVDVPPAFRASGVGK